LLAGERACPQLSMHKAYIRNVLFLQPPLKLGEHRCLRVKRHDAAPWSDPASEGDRHAPRSAARIQDVHPRTYSCPIHQCLRSGDPLDDGVFKDPREGRRAWEEPATGQEPPARGDYHGKDQGDKRNHGNREHAGDGRYDKLEWTISSVDRFVVGGDSGFGIDQLSHKGQNPKH